MTSLREAIIRPGALGDMPALAARLGFKKPFIICDINTYKAAGERLEAFFQQAGAPYALYMFKEHELVPDETALGRIMMSLPPDCDVLIGVGTGTINDLSKYFSFLTGRPYIIAATAPSMDGFASIGAALMRDNLKTTLNAHVPAAIVADVDVLKEAPMDMLLAGLGDILGKYTCLLDWKLSHIINGEYLCETIVEMIECSIQKVSKSAQGIRSRDSGAVAALMEALVLSGIAMSFSGNSRPASGSEHHLSHFLEMRFLFAQRKPVLHGRKVAVGTVTAALLYHKLTQEQIDFAAARRAMEAFDQAGWEKDMQGYYLKASPGVIALERSVGKNSPENCLKQLAAMEKNWPLITEEIKKIPTAQALSSLLESLGAPSTPRDIGVERSLLRDGVIAAKEVRDRFTL
jgi:glycerol-1-phosphate dehydrogenase [NAD(P)+]